MAFGEKNSHTFKQGMGTVKGLNPALINKVDKNQVAGTLEVALNDNTEGNPASTKALAELAANLSDTEQRANALIDDNVSSGDNKTWSIDQIKSYFAEQDDTYFVADLTERDNDTVGIKVPKRQGIRVFVVDASSDDKVGVDKVGNPFGADYIYNNNSWLLIRSLEYRQVDITPFIRYSEVQNNLDSLETNKPLSAAMGKNLKGIIDNSIGGLKLVYDDTAVGENGIIELLQVAKGQAINGMAFVMLNDEIVPVFVSIATDGKTASIISDDASIYVGSECRISYLTGGVATGSVAQTENVVDDTDNTATNTDNTNDTTTENTTETTTDETTTNTDSDTSTNTDDNANGDAESI